MAKTYDLVVIGTGTAASVAAAQCRSAGWRVAVIDHLPFGGTCALRGCDPKKVLVGVAEAIDQARRMRGRGIGGGEPLIEWRDLIAFKRSFTEPVPAMKEKSFAQGGIDAFHGRARFTGQRTIEVADEVLEGRFVLIAAGAVPRRLGIPGEEHLATSTAFLELDALPKRIALVGGGYIAAEFSHIAARAGAKVTVLQSADRMLTLFDPDLVGLLMCRFSDAGNDEAGHTLGDRRRKSAKARNRGGVRHRRCRGLYGDLGEASSWARLDRIARGHRIASRGGFGRRAERALPKQIASAIAGRFSSPQ